MAKQRDGFKDGTHARSNKAPGLVTGTEFDDQLKGDDGVNLIDGGLGDDVIIAYAGDDTAMGGEGADDISGGAGADTLVGGVWVDGETGTAGVIEASEFTQDAARDDFVAEASFEANGTDTILGYDSNDSADESDVYDVVDLSKVVFSFENPDETPELTDDENVLTAAEIEAQLANFITLDSLGNLMIDTDGTGPNEAQTWFNIQAFSEGDAESALDDAFTPATDVTVLVNGYEFTVSYELSI